MKRMTLEGVLAIDWAERHGVPFLWRDEEPAGRVPVEQARRSVRELPDVHVTFHVLQGGVPGVHVLGGPSWFDAGLADAASLPDDVFWLDDDAWEDARRTASNTDGAEPARLLPSSV